MLHRSGPTAGVASLSLATVAVHLALSTLLLHPAQDPTAAAKYPGFGVPNGTALSPAAQQRVNHVMGILSNIRSRPAVRPHARHAMRPALFETVPASAFGPLPTLGCHERMSAVNQHCKSLGV